MLVAVDLLLALLNWFEAVADRVLDVDLSTGVRVETTFIVVGLVGRSAAVSLLSSGSSTDLAWFDLTVALPFVSVHITWSYFAIRLVIQDVDVSLSVHDGGLKVHEVRTRIDLAAQVKASHLAQKWWLNIEGVLVAERVDVAVAPLLSHILADSDGLHHLGVHVDGNLLAEKLLLATKLNFLIPHGLSRLLGVD